MSLGEYSDHFIGGKYSDRWPLMILKPLNASWKFFFSKKYIAK